MRLAVAYYPELRDPADWGADFALIQEAGIERIRVAEFAWSTMAPAPGSYDWAWLDDAIDLAWEYGIEIVLCTPTACPPIWLVEAHPDILPVDRYGRRTGFGARQHRCYNAPAYREHADRITRAMAERYGDHPHVVGWQLDNEFGGEQKRCHCDHCRAAFQAYLGETYGTLDALNARWGTAFWSQTYARWDQIPVPVVHAADLKMRHHPSLELAFSRFSSRSITDFAHRQAAILRAYTSDRPITTNAFMFRWGDNVNWYELFDGLDAAGIDLYTTDPYEIAFYADLVGSLGVPLWVLEYGAHQANLGVGLEVLADHGCAWTCLFKFNPTPFAQEQGRLQLLTVTGAPTANYGVVKAWSARPSPAPPVTDGGAPGDPRPSVGLLYDFDSAWAHAIERWHAPYEEQLVYAKRMVHTVYRGLFELGCDVTFVRTAKDLDKVSRLIVPWCLIHDPALEQGLIDFVRGGGKLLVTDDLFRKNGDNVYLEAAPMIYRELLHWRDADFPESGEATVVQSARVGDGQTWLVRADLTPGEWRGAVVALLGEGESAG